MDGDGIEPPRPDLRSGALPAELTIRSSLSLGDRIPRLAAACDGTAVSHQEDIVSVRRATIPCLRLGKAVCCLLHHGRKNSYFVANVRYYCRHAWGACSRTRRIKL